MGEKITARFLQKIGHHIRATNWTSPSGELDLITWYKGKLHIVEVKTRLHGHPFRGLDGVNSIKQQKIQRQAAIFLRQNRLQNCGVSFDVSEVTVITNPGWSLSKVEVRFYEDAFGGHW